MVRGLLAMLLSVILSCWGQASKTTMGKSQRHHAYSKGSQSAAFAVLLQGAQVWANAAPFSFTHLSNLCGEL